MTTSTKLSRWSAPAEGLGRVALLLDMGGSRVGFGVVEVRDLAYDLLPRGEQSSEPWALDRCRPVSLPG